MASLEAFHASLEHGQRKASPYEAQLASAYKRAMDNAIHAAADRFVAAVKGPVVAAAPPPPDPEGGAAAAGWQIPPAGDLVALDALIQALQAETDPVRRKVLEALISATLETYGISFDLSNPLLDGVFHQMGSNIQGIADTTRRDIMRAVQTAHDEGLSIPHAADEIRAVAEMTTQRAITIARTEIIGASNGSSLAAARLTNAAPYKRWLSAHDTRVRHTHRDADGQTVPLDHPFRVGGEPLMYPGDQINGTANETVACRCTLIYVDEAPMAIAAGGGNMDSVTETLALPTGLHVDAAPESLAEVTAGADWEMTVLVEGSPTDDGRLIMPGAMQWRELPLSLMAMVETQPGHDGAKIAGRIDRIERRGNQIVAHGVFDSGEFGQEIARLVGEKTLRGVSVDMAAKDVRMTNREGLELDPTDLEFANENEVFTTVFDGLVLAATVCPTPAFSETVISLVASGEIRLAVTASAAGLAPLEPPAEWFYMDEPGEPTPLTITSEGQVYGHAALWNTCHIGYPDECVPPPKSPSDYRYFHLGSCTVTSGDAVACGTVTLGTGHAPLSMNKTRAAEHYDNTGTAVADVRARDATLGVWVCGALRPDTPAERVRHLSAGKLSGDWRNIDGRLEMVGLLTVNVPGFPVPHPKAMVAAVMDGENHVESQEVTALVAAGIMRDHPTDVFEYQVSALAALIDGGITNLIEAIGE